MPISAPGKAHMRSTPPQKVSPNDAFETVPVFGSLTMAGPFWSFQGRSSSASSFHASLLQAIDDVVTLALCSKLVSQVPQHFRSLRRKPLAMVA